jgi:hypothetical protein
MPAKSVRDGSDPADLRSTQTILKENCETNRRTDKPLFINNLGQEMGLLYDPHSNRYLARRPKSCVPFGSGCQTHSAYRPAKKLLNEP